MKLIRQHVYRYQKEIERLISIINNKLDYCLPYIENCLKELEGMTDESCPEIYYHLYKYNGNNDYLDKGISLNDISCYFIKYKNGLSDDEQKSLCSNGSSLAAYQIANNHLKENNTEEAIKYYCLSYDLKYPEIKYEYDYHFDGFIKLFLDGSDAIRLIFKKYASERLYRILKATYDIVKIKHSKETDDIIWEAYNKFRYRELLYFLATDKKDVNALEKIFIDDNYNWTEEQHKRLNRCGLFAQSPSYVARKLSKHPVKNFDELEQMANNGNLEACVLSAEANMLYGSLDKSLEYANKLNDSDLKHYNSCAYQIALELYESFDFKKAKKLYFELDKIYGE